MRTLGLMMLVLTVLAFSPGAVAAHDSHCDDGCDHGHYSYTSHRHHPGHNWYAAAGEGYWLGCDSDEHCVYCERTGAATATVVEETVRVVEKRHGTCDCQRHDHGRSHAHHDCCE